MNLFVVFSTGVYVSETSNAPKKCTSPPPLFLLEVQLLHKKKLKSKIFKDKKSL